MGEGIAFRTSLSGFHKGDVLGYIDVLQAGHAEEIAALQESIRQTQERLAQAEEQLNQAARQAEEEQNIRQTMEKENAAMRQRADEWKREEQALRLRAAASEDYQREMRRLSQRLEEQEQRARMELDSRLALCREESAEELRQARERGDKLEADMEALRQATAASRGGREKLEAALKSSENRCEQLRTAVARYEELMGDVGGFIMEVRSMGQRFLEATYQRSEQGLETLDNAVSALEAQLADNRTELEQARQELKDNSAAAGLRLEELVRGLEEAASGAAAAAADSDADSAAAGTAAVAGTGASFFR